MKSAEKLTPDEVAKLEGLDVVAAKINETEQGAALLKRTSVTISERTVLRRERRDQRDKVEGNARNKRT